MLDTAVTAVPPVRASWRGWAGLRALLLAGTVVLVLVALVAGERTADLGDLRADVEAGRVPRVQVTGGLPPGATGTGWQEVRWRAGWQAHRAELRVVAGPVDTTSGDGSDLPVTRRDAGELVQEWDPAVRVERVALDSGTSFSSTVLGARVGGWGVLLVLLHWLGALLLLVHGPEPRRVTRWGWFWLSGLPFGVTVFLLASGPLPGRPHVAPGPHRLRGGRAFVASLLLAGALGGWSTL